MFWGKNFFFFFFFFFFRFSFNFFKGACFSTSIPQSSTEAEWLEKYVAPGFKVWQIMFLCVAGVLALVIFLCCCIRFRIPRTKQEIEADYVRKKLTKKFKKQLQVIQNSEMDDMDLKRGTDRSCSELGSRECVISTVGQETSVQNPPLDRVRAEIKSDTDSLAQSEALSGATLSSGCCNKCSSPAVLPSTPGPQDLQGSLQVPANETSTYRKGSDVNIGLSMEDLPTQGSIGSRFSSIVENTLTKLRPKKAQD
ncbi:hypothetical protein C0J52_13217 [Blattella germanica]|nr:hypothetical protein C0J52_13217 [Blattella germanica]